MIVRGDVFRYVILPSSSYANVYSARITFSVLIPFMTSTYETLIFFPRLLVLTAILLFLTFTRLFLQLSLTNSLALITTNTFCNRAIKRAKLFVFRVATTCNDRYQRLQLVQCACHCYFLRHQFLAIRIDVTCYVKARSHINIQIKTLEKYKIGRSRGRTVFYLLEKKKRFANKINFSKN